MKRLSSIVSGVLGVVAMLAVSAPAWAHVVVSPEEETPTTEIRVEVREGFLLSGLQPVPGWEHTFEEDGGVVRAVIFSGGEIRPREFQQFLVQAQAPEKAGEYLWKAFQTYENGSVVEWTGPPDSEEPASVIDVVSGGSERPQSSRRPSEASASQKAGGEAEVLADTGGTNLAVYAGLGFVGLVVSALLARRLLG